jgi:hypothetical protein
MLDLLQPVLIMVAVMSVLLLGGLLLNRARGKRWDDKASAEGQARCRDCGHVGTLSYGFNPGAQINSSNLRLVCEKCHSENWYVPGGKRDPDRKGSGVIHL